MTGKHAAGSAPEERGRFGAHLGATATIYRERYWREDLLQAVGKLKGLFESTGRSLATGAVAWVLAQPGITSAIIGASRVEQLDETLAGVERVLDDNESRAMDDVWYQLPRRRPGTGPVR